MSSALSRSPPGIATGFPFVVWQPSSGVGCQSTRPPKGFRRSAAEGVRPAASANRGASRSGTGSARSGRPADGSRRRTYYVLAGTTPVLVHNCGNGSSKAEDHVSWVDEGGDLSLGRRGMPQGAYDYQSGVAGARSNAATRYGQAPQLEMPGADGRPVTAKFDGLEGNEIIDRKLNPRFTEKAVDQARRQAATAAYHGLTPVWELPDEAAVSAANRLMPYAKISTIVVRQEG